MIRRNPRRYKTVYSHDQEGMHMHLQCVVNEDTGHIGINRGFAKQHGWSGGAGTNPESNVFLGVFVAEHILSQVFKNITRMPYSNKGYDFIDESGNRIDVKAACRRKDKPTMWGFGINQNTTADYFLCIAFDDRKRLTPLHIWLIPGKILNQSVSVSIGISTLNKWAEYEISAKFGDVINRCNTMTYENMEWKHGY